ncbi:hypothetical protein D3C84_721550 [compost metagenome]
MSRLVVIRQNHYTAARKECIECIRPLASATSIAGCDQSQRLQAQYVLLALHDKHWRTQGCVQQLRQTIGNLTHALHRPHPAAFSVRATLAKVLWLVANNLKQNVAVFVGVVITSRHATAGR